ncbi:MAG: lipoyl(octanoyl) transferase LipB [Kiritimatiellae bacterium]|nr:lipoyl(octanoyl) transferase LipB [Kiritimatiellia bacterium]
MTLCVEDLGRCAYGAVFALQERLVLERGNDDIFDTLLLVEHNPVYTLGRNAKEQNVVADASELARRGIEVVQSSRGGDVTYHGPGQLVGYPIIDLKVQNEGPVWYVGKLEDVIIAVLKEFGIEGSADSKNRGVWVGNEKIAAIGVRIKRHITMHGFSLNVCPNIDDYSGIIPCGIVDKGVTSMAKLIGDVDMDAVKKVVVEKFVAMFGYERVEGKGRGERLKAET